MVTLSGRIVFDRKAKDIFALQDEIVKHVMVELQVKLTQGASARVASRGTDNLEAWLLKIEAHGEFATFTREGMIRARELYEASHHADPDWARPLAGLASVDWYEAKQGWSVSREASIQSGIKLAQQAIEMDPDEPQGYQTLGNLYALNGQGERAIALRRKAVELAPNDLAAVAGLATRLKDFGGEQEAVKLFEQAMRLSPKASLVGSLRLWRDPAPCRSKGRSHSIIQKGHRPQPHPCSSPSIFDRCLC